MVAGERVGSERTQLERGEDIHQGSDIGHCTLRVWHQGLHRPTNEPSLGPRYQLLEVISTLNSSD